METKHKPGGIEPTENDIGRKVVYRTAPYYKPEEGVITSFNNRFVFVRYGNQAGSQATNRDDLDWAFSKATGIEHA